MFLINRDHLGILPTSRKSVLLNLLCTHHKTPKSITACGITYFNHVMDVKLLVWNLLVGKHRLWCWRQMWS